MFGTSKSKLSSTGMQMRYNRLKREAEALRQLALGCPEHPNYRGQRKSKTDCPMCAQLYGLAQKYLFKD